MVDEFTFEGCERPQVQLVGLDGNAFSILGRCRRATRKIWNEAQWRKFHDEATADDYDHLLCTVADYFDLTKKRLMMRKRLITVKIVKSDGDEDVR
jgi:hypothetical protein